MSLVLSLCFVLGLLNAAAIEIELPPPLVVDPISLGTCRVNRGDSCLFGRYFVYDGELTPIKNTEIGTIDIGDSLYFSFDLVLNSDSNDKFKNIIYVGNNNDERTPAIFLKKGVNKLQISVSDTVNGIKGYNPSDELTVKTVYNIKLTIMDGIVTSYIDDVEKVSRSDIDVLQYVDAPIYVSRDGNTAADVTISNLIIQPCGCTVSPTSYSMSSSLTAVGDTQIGTIDIGDSLDISFDLVLHSGPSGNWRSVLHIGKTNEDRLPAIFLQPDENKITFVMSDEDEWNRLYNFNGFILQLNTVYNIRLTIHDGTVTSYLDGVTMYTRSDMNTIEQNNAPIYVSNPWHEAADVTISNLNIGPYVPPPTKSPSAFPTSAPTHEPTLSPTQMPNYIYSSYGGTLIVSENNRVGAVDIGDSLYLSFDLVLNSVTSHSMQSVLLVGDAESNACPQILLTSTNNLVIRINGNEYNIAGVLSSDIVYSIKLFASGEAVTTYLDGIAKLTESDVTIPTQRNSPIYVGDPFFPSVDGTVSNLIIRPHGGKIQLEEDHSLFYDFEEHAYSEISVVGAVSVFFYGVYSGKGSLITAPDGGEFSVRAHGAAKDAVFLCGAGSSCAFSCMSTCINIMMKCIGGGNSCEWQFYNQDSTASDSIFDFTLPSDYQLPNLDNLARRLDEDPNDGDVIISDDTDGLVLTNVGDIFVPVRYGLGGATLNQVGNVYCLAKDSCGSVLYSSLFTNINGDLVIGGDLALYETEIDQVSGSIYVDGVGALSHSPNIENVAGNFVISGIYSVASANINNIGGSIVGYGNYILYRCTIRGVRKIDVKSQIDALTDTTIITDLAAGSIFVLNVDIEVSGGNYHLICSEGNICYINCLGTQSCKNAQFDCDNASCYMYIKSDWQTSGCGCPSITNGNVNGEMFLVQSLLTENSQPDELCSAV